MLDVARLIAAVGVITAHVSDEFFPGSPARILGTYAVPFYLFVALYFTVRGFAIHPERSVGGYLWGRVKKLYVPFLVWNILYELLHVAYHRHDFVLTPPTEMLWAAVYTHLYFLPFLLTVTTLLCIGIRPLMRDRRLRAAAILALSIVAVIVACGPAPMQWQDSKQITHETLWNFHRAIPAACLGTCFALAMGTRKAVVSTRPMIGVAGIALTITCLVVEYHIGQHGLLRAASGFGLTLAAFSSFRAAWLKPLASLGQLSFGVYLSHIALIRVAVALIDHRGWGFNVWTALFAGTFGLVGGLAISSFLASSSWTRWIIGCEETKRGKRPARTAKIETPAGTPIAG